MFKINNGNLYFGKFHALKNINLRIESGERVAFIGHNGAGKSTLIDVLLGIKKLSSGEIKIDENIDNIKDITGVQFQSKEYPHGLKVKHLLLFYLNLYKMKINSQYVQDLLKEFGLETKLNMKITSLSGGQQQKLNILIAFLNNPKLLILDEVLTGLDITSQQSVFESVKRKIDENADITLIVVSHSAIELEKYIDRLIVLSSGEIIDDIKVSDVNKKYGGMPEFLKTLRPKEI